MADFRQSSVEEVGGIARCSSCPETEIPEKWYSSREFGSSALDQGPVRPVSTGYPQLNVDNYCGVWELEGLPRNYYKCANPLTP